MSITAEPLDLKPLVTWLHNHPGPHDLDALVHRAAEFIVENAAQPRFYTPAAHYTTGERVWIDGDVAEVVDVRYCRNPRQGRFAVVELVYPNGLKRRVVADIPNAPGSVADEVVTRVVQNRGGEIRRALTSHPDVMAFIRTTETAPPAPASGEAAQLRGGPRAGRAAALFAEPVLQELAADLPEEREAHRRRHVARLHEAWRQARADGHTWSRTETWEHVVLPALELLGWAPLALPRPGAYALFARAADRDRAANRERAANRDLAADAPATGAGVEGAVAHLVVERWASPPGYTQPGQKGVSPELRTVGDLLAGGWTWSIFTDGSCWRLYGSSRGDPQIGSAAAEYQQIDLAGIFDFLPPSGEPSAAQWAQFSRWYRLFSADAFSSDPDRPPLVERLKVASAAYMDDVVVRLRDRLLTSVLPEIAGGFIAYRYQHLGVREEDDAARREIVRASFGLVYRLLFLLSGEHRHLMPLHNPDYRGQSLTTLLRWAAESLDHSLPLSPALHLTPRYDALLTLFRLLEHGEPALELPSYADGLFSPVDPDQSFLERHRLSDRVVARTLDALGRMDGKPIDYAVLTVRHLSAIAEGLLETMLWVVEAPAGMVALLNHQGEYQVDDGLVLTDAANLARLAEAFGEVMAIRGRDFALAMDRIGALKRDGVDADSDAQEVRALRTAEKAAYEALLGVKILDPAMGAGTFLVAAVDLWTDSVIQQMAAYHRAHPEVPWSWNPVYGAVVEERRRLLDEIEHQGFVAYPSFLSEVTVLTRLVIEHAVYGIDLNPVAVSLSKTTLRMRAFAVGVPFPYLDAHLRRGNSLLGARIQDLAAASEPSLAMLASRFATLVADTTYELAMRDALLPYESLLDLWAGQVLVPEEQADELRRLARALARFMRTGRSETDAGEVKQAFARAAALRQHYHFVHWDFVYPEVFLGARESGDARPGFDLVIGCPPEVRFGTVGDIVCTEDESAFLSLGHRLLCEPHGRVLLVEAASRVVDAAGLSDNPPDFHRMIYEPSPST